VVGTYLAASWRDDPVNAPDLFNNNQHINELTEFFNQEPIWDQVDMDLTREWDQVEGPMPEVCDKNVDIIFGLRDGDIHKGDSTLKRKGISGSNALSISVSPNPADDYINIESNISVTGDLVIYDLQGRRVIEQKLTNALNTRLDISSIKNTGVYLLLVQNEDQLDMKKIEIVR